MSVGGVDTYYDYDERRWKFRRLGGSPGSSTLDAGGVVWGADRLAFRGSALT
jgi:hypothetical protein